MHGPFSLPEHADPELLNTAKFLTQLVALPPDFWGRVMHSAIINNADAPNATHVTVDIIAALEGPLQVVRCERCGARHETLIDLRELGEVDWPELKIGVEMLADSFARVMPMWLPRHLGCDAQPMRHTLPPRIAKLLSTMVGAAVTHLDAGQRAPGEFVVLLANGQVLPLAFAELPPWDSDEGRPRAMAVHALHAGIRKVARDMRTEPVGAVLVAQERWEAEVADSEAVDVLTAIAATRDFALAGSTPVRQDGHGRALVHSLELSAMPACGILDGLLARSMPYTAARALQR